jgi:hypothetical protein
MSDISKKIQDLRVKRFALIKKIRELRNKINTLERS